MVVDGDVSLDDKLIDILGDEAWYSHQPIDSDQMIGSSLRLDPALPQRLEPAAGVLQMWGIHVVGHGVVSAVVIHTRAPWHFQSPDSPMLARQFEALAFQNVHTHASPT